MGDRSSTQRSRTVGKAILFAPESIEVPDLSAWLQEPLDRAGRWPVPRIADVPHAGTHFNAGQPICTVFALHQSVDGCHRALTEAAGTLYAQFVPTGD